MMPMLQLMVTDSSQLELFVRIEKGSVNYTGSEAIASYIVEYIDRVFNE